MAKVNQAQEPSMEEILASIRRIIADDEPVAAAPPEIDRPSLPPAPEEHEADDREDAATVMPSLRATPPEPNRPRVMQDAPPFVPLPSRPPAPITAQFQPQRPPERQPVPVAPPPALADEMRNGLPLLSPTSDAIVQSAFGNLANTILAGNQRTLEDLVKDMLRPMLKAWLDTNLPPLVEKLVRDEIERVSRGR